MYIHNIMMSDIMASDVTRISRLGQKNWQIGWEWGTIKFWTCRREILRFSPF